MFRSIIRLERITHLNRNPRTDMWVTKEAAASLMRAIRSMTRERTPLFCEVVRDQIRDGAHRTRALGSWRLAIWQPWKDRVGPSVTVDSGKARKETSAVLTLNVNGFVHKKWELAEILRKENVAIACLQETVVGDKQYPVRLSGYNTFDVPWQEGFRGQAVLVDSRLPAYEVPHGEQFVIHVKVSRFHGFKRPLHVLGVYLPSGGNFRRERTSRFNKLVGICRDILRSEPGAVIVALGDFNMPVPRIRSLSPADAEVLARLTPVGSALSRFPRRGKPGAIDHVMVSGAAKQAFRRPRVLRHGPSVDSQRCLAGTTEDL
ncbi:uncharacterized protein STEHIDRAFT_126705 [Stereum hirsutum FP-91666 SS1]|uniref:uncharacterized protein n=1 Tax=Stereum hirsutum (strain FP-91666) TaxID=721885 RepID=UPI000440BAF0|nr:uncharacterized protein STEHIDRAFT_126705 [Stereum hirsutum FP-91666 SS1]EIM91698.1 hypothetical protein STEHIDRAFT_126705 [Stereum hirsutum FP-91666 SS1]